MRTLATLSGLAVASAFVAPAAQRPSTCLKMGLGEDLQKAGAAAMAAISLGSTLMGALPAQAVTASDLAQLSYLQVKGSGLANRCPEVVGEGSLALSGKKEIVDLCIEPTQFQVLETSVDKRTGAVKKEYVNTKLMTRQTYTLYGINGPISSEGGFTFKEKDGIDYAATTVQLPGGERVPFLFTIKELVAKGSGGSAIKPGFQFGGPYKVPSYRTGLFLDPKGRGGTTGYDMAVALPAKQVGLEGDKELFKENNKVFNVLDGEIQFEVNRVNAADGEFGGVFVAKQKGDTDMGSKKPKDLLLKGIFSARLE